MWFKVLVACGIVSTFVYSKTVDLSWKGLKKEEFFTAHQKQVEMHEVTELLLQGNEFDSFLDCSTNLNKLKILDLSQNKLQRFFFLCRDEYELEKLNVSHNMLEYLDDTAINNRIPKLKTLDLSFNSLNGVNETMLEHLLALEYLSLEENPIGDDIDDRAFWKLKNLKYLNLQHIEMTYVPGLLFKNCNNLTTLDLSRNAIDSLPHLPTSLELLDLSSTDISRFHGLFTNLMRLKELRINDMTNLTALTLNDFEHLTSLETLSVVNCKQMQVIQVYPGSSSLLLPHLANLYLNNSGVTSLSESIGPVIKKLTVLEIEGNPWTCDCKISWITQANVTVGHSSLSRKIRCAEPLEQKSRYLSDISSEELECKQVTTTLHPTIWIGMSVLILGMLLFGAFFLLREPIAQWTMRGKGRETVAYTNVIESSNDLVRILAQGDNHDNNED